MAAPTPIPVPVGYDPEIPLRKAAVIYGVSRGTLSRWRRDVGYRGTRGVHAPWTEAEDRQLRDDFSALNLDQLSSLIGRTASAVKSRALLLGLRKASTRFRRDLRAAFAGQRVMGHADLAAAHIRAHDRVAIFRCDSDGQPDPKGGFWKYGYGSLVLTDGELIAKAERKGWNPDEWRRVAA